MCGSIFIFHGPRCLRCLHFVQASDVIYCLRRWLCPTFDISRALDSHVTEICCCDWTGATQFNTCSMCGVLARAGVEENRCFEGEFCGFSTVFVAKKLSQLCQDSAPSHRYRYLNSRRKRYFWRSLLRAGIELRRG